MLIQKFRKYQFSTPLVLLLSGLVLWLDGFILYSRVNISLEEAAPLYNLVGGLFKNYPLLNVSLAFVFLYFQSFMVNQLVTSKNLIDRQSFLPGFLYLVLMSSSFEMLSLHPVLFANFFLIIALNKILEVYDEKDVMLEVFNVGMLISLAGLFYFPALVLFILLIIALGIYFLANLRGVIASLLGFLTPFLFLGVYYYWRDVLALKFEELFSGFGVFHIFRQDFSAFSKVYGVFLVVLAFFAFLSLVFRYLGDKPVRIRKRFTVVLYYFMVSVVSAFFVTHYFDVLYGLFMLPLSIVLAVFFQEIKRNVWAEVLFSLMIFLIVAGKLARLD